MDYSKVITIDNYDLDPIKDLPDYEERVQLLKSYIGQRTYLCAKAIPRAVKRIETNRRVKRPQDKCIEHYQNLDKAWEEKIQLILQGAPLEEVKGKLKVPTSMPASTKHSARYHIHQERLAKKRARRKRAREREANKGN